MVCTGKSIEKCLNVFSGLPWKLLAKGHLLSHVMVQLVSYQSLGAGPNFDSRLIKVRFVVEKKKWHWDGSYPVSVIPLMIHIDLHLGNTLTRKTCR
jgi:hypothetical protein